MIEIMEFQEYDKKQQQEIAFQVSQLTQGIEGEVLQMLALTPEDVFAKYLAVVAMTETSVVGFVAVNQIVSHATQKMSEIGSLYVRQAARGQGLGRGLVALATSAVVDLGVMPYAFCNPLSRGVFEQAGYVEARADMIPSEAFLLCSRCPVRAGNACCDHMVIYAGTSQ
jgi:predicted N-acetyltransferase YhbS